MANLLTAVETINTEQYDLFLEPLLSDVQISKLPFNLIYGNMPRELHFVPNVDKITGAKTACGWNDKGGGLSAAKKTLTPIELAATVKQCYTVVMKKLFGNKLPNGYIRGKLYTELIDWMQSQRQYSFNRDLLSILFLGDTGISADDYYSLSDGVYKKLAAGVAAVDGTVNAGVTLNSTTLNTSNFYTTMKSVYDKQSRNLKNVEKAKKVWIWTEATYELYTNYLTVSTQNTAGSIQTENVVNGTDATHFVGIPIIVLPIIDERLDVDFLTGSPAAATDPYRTILTDPTNHTILMDGDGMLSTEPFYLPKEDEVWVPGSALFAYDYGFGDLNVIAGLTI